MLALPAEEVGPVLQRFLRSASTLKVDRNPSLLTTEHRCVAVPAPCICTCPARKTPLVNHAACKPWHNPMQRVGRLNPVNATALQVGYGLIGDLAALAVRLGRHECVATAAPAIDVGSVHRTLYQRRVAGINKVGFAP